MSRLVKWRDRSHRISENPERWVPEASIFILEGSTITQHLLYLSDDDIEKVKRGEWVFSTPVEAKAQAYALAKKSVLEIYRGEEVA